VSVYGYPREPEGTGDEIPLPDVPYRVTSQPVSVPNSPLPPPEPLLPPQPLLPAHPPGAPYLPGAEFIPTQRQATDPVPASDTVRTGASGGVGPDERDTSAPQRAEAEEDSGSGFQWLKPARSNPASAAASAAPSPPPAPALADVPPPPADPLGRPSPVSEPPSGSLPRPVSPAMGQPPASAPPPGSAPPAASASVRPGFGSGPAMGQPGPAERSGHGSFGLMGQPPSGDGGLAVGGVPPADGSAIAGASGSAGELAAPGDGAGPGPSPLPRRKPYAAGSTGSAAASAAPMSAAPTSAAPTSPPATAAAAGSAAPGPAAPGSVAAGPAAMPASAPAAEPLSAPEAPPTSAPPTGPEPSSPAGTVGPATTGAPGTGPSSAGPAGPVPPGPVPPSTVPPSRVPPSTVSPTVGDGPEIQPWDRRPLLVVIASAVVLVLIGIVSGMVTMALASSPRAAWHEGESAEPDPGSVPSADPTPAAPAEGETITLAGVGDVIMGSVNLGVPPNEGAGFFDGVREALAADLVMGNLDQALSEPTGYEKCDPGATDCFQLSLPPTYAKVLRDGGFDLMNLANNHTYDMGPQGYANTRAALESAGIATTGGVDEITYVTVKGIRVAVLGFSVYSYTANLNDIDGAADLVREAAAEADLVVVQMQGGAEGADRTRVPPVGQHESFGGEDRGDLRGFAHAVIDAGADIVFGHGPHVMRGMEFYQGRLIAYSLGNFCGYAVLSSTGWSGVGGILKVTLTRDGTWVSGELIATEMVNRGLPALDQERRALAFVDELSVADFGNAAARIDHSTGVITAP